MRTVRKRYILTRIVYTGCNVFLGVSEDIKPQNLSIINHGYRLGLFQNQLLIEKASY